MEYFLQAFGGVDIGWAVIIIGAIIFMIACYKKIEKYFSDKAVNENEYEKRIEKMLEQAEKYPEWHEQSIAIRKEINDHLANLGEKVDNLQAASDNGIALTWRYRILRFDDEIRHDEKHTKEHFDQILEDITKYERYCEEHPDFPNNKAVFAIKNIKDVYEKCVKEGSFL